MSKRILLTSVCRPLGPEYGDAPSVGYELLYRQVLRAQGIFSPRTVNIHFGLEYIAENLDAPTVVLQYPSKSELIRELKKGYDYVGISFIMAVMHKMKEAVALIRKYAPNSKIVLGGYGTVLKDDVLKPYGDYICREEGVAFFRRLLGEKEIPMPYKHPLIVSWLKVFGWKVSGTGKIFAGLGCPNGCSPASKPSANTPWKKSWRWVLTVSGSATKARDPITPSSRAGPLRTFSPSSASTASRC